MIRNFKKLLLLITFAGCSFSCGIKGPPLPPLETIETQANNDNIQEAAPVSANPAPTTTEPTQKKNKPLQKKQAQ